jgi:hypothetical protein
MRNRVGCFWSSPVRVPDVIPLEEKYTYIYLNMAHWNNKIYREKQLGADLFSLILRAIALLRLPAPTTKTPEALRRELQAINFKLAEFNSEEEAIKHAAAQPEGKGIILKIKNMDGYVNAEQTVWIRTTGSAGSTLAFVPPELRQLLATPVCSAFHARSHHQLIATLYTNIRQISEAYLAKYPQIMHKLFFGSHTHQDAAIELANLASYPPSSLGSYLNFLTEYKNIYQSLSRGQLSQNLYRQANVLIYESIRNLLGITTADCRIWYSFNWYIQQVTTRFQLEAPKPLNLTTLHKKSL